MFSKEVIELDEKIIYILREYCNNRTKQKRVTLTQCKLYGVKQRLLCMCKSEPKIRKRVDKLSELDIIIVDEYSYEISIIDRSNYDEVKIESDEIYYSLVEYMNNFYTGSDTITAYGYNDIVKDIIKDNHKEKSLGIIVVEDESKFIVSVDDIKNKLVSGSKSITKVLMYKNLFKIKEIVYINDDSTILFILKDKSYYAFKVTKKVYDELKL